MILAAIRDPSCLRVNACFHYKNLTVKSIRCWGQLNFSLTITDQSVHTTTSTHKPMVQYFRCIQMYYWAVKSTWLENYSYCHKNVRVRQWMCWHYTESWRWGIPKGPLCCFSLKTPWYKIKAFYFYAFGRRIFKRFIIHIRHSFFQHCCFLFCFSDRCCYRYSTA